MFLLSKFLFFYYKKKVYILIDEYDAPANHAYQVCLINHRMRREHKHVDIIPDDFPLKTSDFIKHWLGEALKGNPFLAKGLLTGVFPMSKRNSGSDLNNVEVYTLLDRRYAECFGFTEQEVSQVLAATRLAQTMPLTDLSQWYNGYQVITYSEKKERLYNPWSIMSALRNKTIGPHWEETGSHEFIENYLRHNEGFRRLMLPIVNGEKLAVQLSRTLNYETMYAYDGATATPEHDIWSLLFHLGYLTLDGDHLNQHRIPQLGEYHVRYPNHEVHQMYLTLLKRCVFLPSFTPLQQQFIDSLSAHEPGQFASALNQLLLQHTSTFDFNCESNCQIAMDVFFSMLASGVYFSRANSEEWGLGRSDQILLPTHGNTAWVMEYKYIEGAQREQEAAVFKALDQILKKRYLAGFQKPEYARIKDIFIVGISFWKKTALLGSQYRSLEASDENPPIRLFRPSESASQEESEVKENPVTVSRLKRERTENQISVQALIQKQAQEGRRRHKRIPSVANEAEQTEERAPKKQERR